MVAFLAEVVPAAQRFSAYQIANMPTFFVHQSDVGTRPFLALSLGQASERCQRTANPGTLVPSTGPERTARAFAQYLRVGACFSPRASTRTSLVLGTADLSGCGTAPAWAYKHDRARRAGSGVALRRTHVLTPFKRLHAGGLASRDWIGTQDTGQNCARREEGSRVGSQSMLAAWTVSNERRRVGTGRRSD